MPYANFGTRFAAALLDGIILYIPTSIVRVVGAIIFPNFGGYDAIAKLALISNATDEAQRAEAMSQFVVAVMPAYMLSLVITMWPYNALMESSSKQATLGKMALGIVVVDLSGKRISFARATGRFFSKFFVSSILIIGIGYLFAAFTKKKQALHDLIAGTLVVNRR